MWAGLGIKTLLIYWDFLAQTCLGFIEIAAKKNNISSEQLLWLKMPRSCQRSKETGETAIPASKEQENAKLINRRLEEHCLVRQVFAATFGWWSQNLV